MLADLALKTAYHKGDDDIANDFYLPCMRRAVQYDRAVGYFRSSIFILAWPSLREFVRQGGRMRVLCSQVLADADIEALSEGYAGRVEDGIARRLEQEVQSMLAEEALRSPTRILAALVSAGVLEIQIAVLGQSDIKSAQGRIFHDKLGIFTDVDGNVVTFKGSMNETWVGLAADGNLESVDVTASWLGERDRERGANEVHYFSRLWGNKYPGLTVRPFPEMAMTLLKAQASPDWEEDLERALLDRAQHQSDFKGRVLKPHQSAGLASWHANDRRGILAFATGSGKTFTALTAIRDAIGERREPVLVVAPDTTMFRQWRAELEQGLADLDVDILKAGAGHSKWRDALPIWTAQGDRRRLVLSTLGTASSDDFVARLAGGDHLMIVADEVHRLGAAKRRNLMRPHLFGARLGLSATPERAGDPLGTSALLEFFDRVLEPRYTLADAVRDGVLCKYFYRPHAVTLDADEMVEWKRLTGQIDQLWARKQSQGSLGQLEDRLQRLLFERAKVLKKAKGKVPLAVQLLEAEFKPGQRWIVYCDDVEQLQDVMAHLRLRRLQPMPYHSQMLGDRAATLKWLETEGGIVVSIKCLDEGVDIPSVTHALILASSKNPREFVQRRGRVLRTAPSKTLAYIHDAIVLPALSHDSNGTNDRIAAGEVARAMEFASHADNPAAGADLEVAVLSAGLDWAGLGSEGLEDGDI